MIEIADSKGTQAGLASDSIATRRAAMIALDQMRGGKLEAESVIAELDSPDVSMLSAGPDKTFRIRRDSIDTMNRNETSIMPAGLEKTLGEQELADLIAYLKSL